VREQVEAVDEEAIAFRRVRLGHRYRCGQR
jgi:hypothetical protein